MSALGSHHVRHLPPGPLDTDAHDSSHIPPLSLSGHPGAADFDTALAAGHCQNVGLERTRLPRRTSALSYQHSAAPSRDLRDRTGGYSRGPRNLVVVIPPPDFPLNHGQLGNVLSMGPRHRLSQGILLPLFPSMFGQLNAIAREYNFPSTVGLCLYLHIYENGITMTPRISDDSWQYLFGHLFENRAPSSTQQLPIGGSIEFDIDLNKARWFDAWVSGTLRDPDPIYPSLETSQISLGAHWRGESQPRGVDEQVEDRWDTSTRSQTLVTNSQPATLRHVPKKLSLVDRLESLGVHPPPKSQSRPDHPESPPTHETPSLSPVPQSAIPRLPKSDLELRVNSWRESTELYSISMTETYQPVPDVGIPVGPTTMDAYAMERNFQQAHETCVWSPTSAGPRSPAPESQFVSPRLGPSLVHVNGSVPITPAIATNWGPGDDEWHSVVSTPTPLPSPDTGERVVGDTIAPRRNAVWGNSYGWRSATTWNKVYPYSISQARPAVRVQLQGGVSVYPDMVIYPVVASASNNFGIGSPPRSVWGTSFGWQRAATWRKVYPYSVVRLGSIATIQLRGAGGLVSDYPNIDIYPTVYPHLEIYPAVTVEERSIRTVSEMLRKSSNFTMHYPSLVIYPAVYPHFDIYPTIMKSIEVKVSSPSDTPNTLITYPNLVIYPAVYPHFDLYPKALQVSKIIKQKEVTVKLANASGLSAEYPNMTIYPSVYPCLDIFPARETRMRVSSRVWGISFGWLTAKTWNQVYPLHIANPLTGKDVVDAQSTAGLQPSSQSPTTAASAVKKEAVWGSSFGWKDATTWRAVWPTSHAKIYPGAHKGSVYLQNVTSSNYPNLVIYPTTYPHFAINPHPAAGVMAKGSRTMQGYNHLSADLSLHYPYLVIYPAVYPHFDLYPAVAADFVHVERGQSQSNLRRRRIAMWRARTAAQIGLDELLANNHCWESNEPLQLDLAEYAWSRTSAGPPTSSLKSLFTASIPRSVHIAHRVQGSVLRTPSTATTWGPQEDDWYSDVTSIERLPSPDLGQRVLDDAEDTHRPWRMERPFNEVATRLETFHRYPHLVIYPPVYPYFDLYPRANVPSNVQVTRTTEILASTSQPKTHSFVSVCKYPHLVIYPPVYPYFDLYPACANAPAKAQVTRTTEDLACALPAYPYLVIYPPVYPFFDLYPACTNAHKAQVTENFEIIVNSTRYPVFDIYPAVYPYFNIYPAFDMRRETHNVAVSAVHRQPVEVRLPSLYPNLSICYPSNLNSIYPSVTTIKSAQITVAISHGYPWLVIYQPMYPFVSPYPGFIDKITRRVITEQSASVSSEVLKSVCLKLPVCYPAFDLYPAGYPWSLETIYPAVSVDDYSALVVPKPHPVLQLDPVRVTGTLDEVDYESVKASFLASEDIGRGSVVSAAPPDSSLFPLPPTKMPQREQTKEDAHHSAVPVPQIHTVAPRQRKTHLELHNAVFRSLGKRPARAIKTHQQLHNEVFQGEAVWTPSGYTQDITSLTTRKPCVDVPTAVSPRRYDSISPRTPHSRPAGPVVQSPERVVFPLVQPPALPPISPLRVRSPGVPSQPLPAVSESPMPRVSSPTHAFTHKRTTSSRLTQAVKSIMPGLPRRGSSASRPTTPPLPEEYKQSARDQQQQTPIKFPSMVERRPTAVPPLPHTNVPEILTRIPQRKESLVLQRARAYEHSTVSTPSSGTIGHKEAHTLFTLPPLPSIPPMTDMVETFEKSKLTFP